MQSSLHESLEKAAAVLPQGGSDIVLKEMLATMECSGGGGGGSGNSNSSSSQAAPATTGKTDLKAIIKHILSQDENWMETSAFMQMNNKLIVNDNPSYISFYQSLKKRICTCDPDGWDAAPCNFHDEQVHTVADYIWGIAQAGCGRIPESIALLGNAVIIHMLQLKIEKDAKRAQELKDGVAEKDKASDEDCSATSCHAILH
jgi:hypothetical protein